MNSDESSPGITFVVIEAFHLNCLKLVIELKGMLSYPVSSLFKLFLVIFHRHRSILKSTYYRSKTGRYHLLLLLLPILCRAASSAALSHTGGFRVGGGVHDSYTFQCGLMGSFTSPGIDTR